MDTSLDYVIYFVGSGLAFFVGVAAILAGLAISLRAVGRAAAHARDLVVMLGGLFVVISAAPLEWWVYAVAAALTGVWLPLEWYRNILPSRVLGASRLAVLLVWLLALALEIPFHVTPALPLLNKPTLFLVGDSVSAGILESEKGTWPRLFAKQHDVDMRDFSKAGATVESARKQAEKIGNGSGIVLLEIGGNDLLGTTSAEQFEEQLDLLLGDVCREDRLVVMLGLPLPPFANRFGRIQRQLARKYDVILIPQRVFAGIITAPGATVDGIHLTPVGHQRMADTMWTLIRSAYE